jgi:deoxyuridine 5'-triphosphate nucleotidohydrolase
MSGLGSVAVYPIRPDSTIPRRATPKAIGFDVFASRVLDRNTKEVLGELPVTIAPGEAVLIGIGVIIAIPMMHEIQVRPRSGLASKYDVELSNSPGTVDPDFRGEVGVLLRNRGKKPFTVHLNDRIAQLIFSSVEIPDFRVVANKEDLSPTLRNTGGFGSTGLTGFGMGTLEYDLEIARNDRYFMRIAISTAAMSNCVRGCKRGEDGQFPRDEEGYLIGQTRRYGCLITKGLRVIATGFNAQYPGSKLCSETGCLRDELGIPSGTQFETCRAIHAEEMAILTAANQGIAVAEATAYVNSVPCKNCAKLIAGSGIETLVVLKGAYGEIHGLEIVKEAGIRVREISM